MVSQPRGVTCTPLVSCSIDTDVERIELDQERNVVSQSRDKFARYFASHYDRVGLRIEWGRFAFCSSGPTRSFHRKGGKKFTSVISEASFVRGAFKIDEFLIGHDGSRFVDEIFVSLYCWFCGEKLILYLTGRISF